MKSNDNIIKGSRKAWFFYTQAIKSVVLSALILTSIQWPLQAQVSLYTKPSWWFGVAGGANLNFYRGSTQQLNSAFTSLAAFHNGTGVGLFLAPLVEFHRPDSRWGIMLQAGYDSRKGKFDQISTPCNCPADLTTNLSYITVEPSLRFAPFKSNLYLFGGPRFAYNYSKSFTYEQGINPEYPLQITTPDVKGDFSDINKMIISMQIGAGYDIAISSKDRQTQYVLSPFISFQPYFGQDPRSVETWNVTTLRVGAALKFGRGRNSSPKQYDAIVDPNVRFYVISPKNIPTERRVREIFPLRNYIFFDLGSSEIPDRYVLLNKSQVKDFKEDQLEVLIPKSLPGRSAREMIVYYNVLNILGDRMGKNPTTVITLTGSSMEGEDDGIAMAKSIQHYLVEVFGIDPSRIKTEGRIKPRIPSEHPGGTKELDLLREGDRRVSVWSDSPVLMMEFQSGPDAPLKPIEILAVQQAPLDSYVSFNVDGAKEAFTSWSLEIRNEKGEVQYFGPYTEEQVNLPGKIFLGSISKGEYKATMVGHTLSGNIVKKEATVQIVLWKPSKDEQGMRFSIIYEFNESKAITMYNKYLTDVVMPKIPIGATVILHGHTDVIGEPAHNKALSLARANDVRYILENALSNAGRSDVIFEVYGFGEDVNLSPFENSLPEERFYNRTVIIDIIPKK